MPPRGKDAKDRTSLVLAAVFHGVVIALVLGWAAKTGRLDRALRAIGVVPQRKEPPKPRPEPARRHRSEPTPPSSPQRVLPAGGSRRAVAADAPQASGGGSFFQDLRPQTAGPAQAGGGGPATRAAVPAGPVAATAPAMRAAAPSTIAALLAERQNAAAATESFGSEQIARTGVSDAGDIITKVAGASVVDGRFAVIRGLSERYVTTTLNGAELPSADPYRRSAPLDLFPAQIIEKVVISKTFTPDQPGTYTGGGINIITRSFPQQGFTAVSVGASYNTQSSLNSGFLSYPGGSLDWAGLDDGSRALKPGLSDPSVTAPTPPFSTGASTSPNYAKRQAEAEALRALTSSMGVTTFRARPSGAPLNHNFSLATGDTTHFLGRPLGYFAGVSYHRNFAFYGDGLTRRYVPGVGPGSFQLRRDSTDAKAVAEAGWAGVANLGYRLGDQHELGFNFLHNQAGEDVARRQQTLSSDDPGVRFELNRLHYTQRNLNTFQLKGGHGMGEEAVVKVDWLAALSTTSQEEPDTRFFNYAVEGADAVLGKASIPDPKNPTRYFRDLEEANRNLKLDLTLPFRQWRSLESELKVGINDSRSERLFTDRELYYQGDAPFDGDPNHYLTDSNLGYHASTNAANGRITYQWDRYLQTRDSRYASELAVRAGYVMVDMPATARIRLIGGVRYESTDLGVTSSSYLANSITGKANNSTRLDGGALLPAVSVVFSPSARSNLRLTYAHTIARPSFRELAGYRSYDPTLDELLDGNPNLRLSSIVNYDLRWEWFPRAGELLSASLFYKDIADAIERRYVTIDGEIITFDNREKARVYGLELEARKSLGFLSPLSELFSLGGNLSIIQSEVRLTPGELVARSAALGQTPSSRPLYDQAPYIFNADLTYDNRYSGTTATLAFNLAGPRVTIASLNSEDIYEQPAGSLDLVVSQRINRNLKVKVTARNLLDPPLQRTYGSSGAGLLYSSHHRGRTFGLALSYEF